MKSLDNINKLIDDTNDKLTSAKELANGNPSMASKMMIEGLKSRLCMYNQIKKDLEVLEILKKRLYK